MGKEKAKVSRLLYLERLLEDIAERARIGLSIPDKHAQFFSLGGMATVQRPTHSIPSWKLPDVIQHANLCLCRICTKSVAAQTRWPKEVGLMFPSGGRVTRIRTGPSPKADQFGAKQATAYANPPVLLRRPYESLESKQFRVRHQGALVCNRPKTS